MRPEHIEILVEAPATTGAEFEALVGGVLEIVTSRLQEGLGLDHPVDHVEWSHLRVGVQRTSTSEKPARALSRFRDVLKGEDQINFELGWTPDFRTHFTRRVSGQFGGRFDAWEPRLAGLHIKYDYAPLLEDDVLHAIETVARMTLVEIAASFEIEFASISDDGDSYLHTGLDDATAGSPAMYRAREADVLTAYAWTTYVEAALLDRLGGAGSLRESGAFWRVDEVGSGALLMATEHLADFAGDRVRAVKNALEPVLLNAPMASPDHPTHQHLRVAWDDGRNGPLGPRYGRPGNPAGAGGGSRTPTP